MFWQENISTKHVFIINNCSICEKSCEKQSEHPREKPKVKQDKQAQVLVLLELPAYDDCDLAKGEESSSTSSADDLSEEDNPYSETKEGVANSRATQTRPKLKSRRSQATLGECLKCSKRRMKIKLLQKQKGRLRSKMEKCKEAAQEDIVRHR